MRFWKLGLVSFFHGGMSAILFQKVRSYLSWWLTSLAILLPTWLLVTTDASLYVSGADFAPSSGTVVREVSPTNQPSETERHFSSALPLVSISQGSSGQGLDKQYHSDHLSKPSRGHQEVWGLFRTSGRRCSHPKCGKHGLGSRGVVPSPDSLSSNLSEVGTP